MVSKTKYTGFLVFMSKLFGPENKNSTFYNKIMNLRYLLLEKKFCISTLI